jgi:hypothetical protein
VSLVAADDAQQLDFADGSQQAFCAAGEQQVFLSDMGFTSAGR